jgi:hypothetical protein
VLPFVVLSVGSALPALVLSGVANAQGFYFIALLNAIFYTVLTLVIFIRHNVENNRPHVFSLAASKSQPLLQAIAAMVILVPLAAIPVRLPVGLNAILQGSQRLLPSQYMRRFGDQVAPLAVRTIVPRTS